MKAGICTGKESLVFRDLLIPDCDENDVLIENLYAAVCEEDLSLYLNGCRKAVETNGSAADSDPAASAEGREFGLSGLSQVAECGMNALDFNLGERVYALPSGSSSAFSEFSLIRDAQYNKNLYPIPDSVSDRAACLIRPFARGCHAARSAMRLRPAEQVYYIASDQQSYRGDIRYADGDSAVVFGDGITGIAAGICLLWFGMEKVMICGSSDLRLSLVKNFGLLSCKADSLSPEGLKGYDCWIDTTGSAAVLSYYILYGKEGSRLISAAPVCQPAIVDIQKLTQENRRIIGSGAYTEDDVRETVSILASGIWDFDSLYTHEYSIDELEEALRTAADPELSCMVGVHF